MAEYRAATAGNINKKRIKPLDLSVKQTTETSDTLSHASTATLNGGARDIERPVKIKWTFIDESADQRLGTACRKLREGRRDRINVTEMNALQSEPTKASSNYQPTVWSKGGQFSLPKDQFGKLRAQANFSDMAQTHTKSMGATLV